MAHLNVHERRIEAKIAYVGAQLAGKATNFEHLRKESRASSAEDDDDDLLSLEWRPADATTFRDCDVTVKVVAQRGAFEAGVARDLLRDADGVVLVVDATPDASERNRTSFAAVKEALAASPARQVPIVVQVNKSDLEGALPASEVARALETEAWPHVVASALRGEGVLETLARAVDDVLQSMREGDGEGGEREAGTPFTPDETRRGEGNPLLTALKQVLRETVTVHLSELEGRQAARLDAALERSFARQNDQLREHGLLLQKQNELGQRIAEQLQKQSDALQKLQKQQDQTRITLESRIDDARTILARVEAIALGIAAAQTAFETSAAAERERADRTTSTVTRALGDLARREDVAKIEPRICTEIETLRKDTKRDFTKLLEATTRAERDTAATLDTLVGEVGQAARAALAVPPRLADIESKVRAELAEGVVTRVTSLERSVHAATADTSKAIQHVDGRTAEVQEQIAELVEELKKRKKGWFA